jgi:hypothetical protein
MSAKWKLTKKREMPFKIKRRPVAALEILKAYNWYEVQREGLGTEFLEKLEDLLQQTRKTSAALFLLS